MHQMRKTLAGRDVVARSMMTEIREGRGCDTLNMVHISSLNLIT